MDGTIYHCYATTTGDGDERVDTYVVAGLGRISIDRDSGEVASIVALTPSGVPILKRLAHVRSPQRERQVPNLITARLLSRAIRCKVAGCVSRSSRRCVRRRGPRVLVDTSCAAGRDHVPQGRGADPPKELPDVPRAGRHRAVLADDLLRRETLRGGHGLADAEQGDASVGSAEHERVHPRFSWKNDVRLSDQELATIKAWHDGGDWEGNPADAPPPHHGAAGHVPRRRAAAHVGHAVHADADARLLPLLRPRSEAHHFDVPRRDEHHPGQQDDRAPRARLLGAVRRADPSADATASRTSTTASAARASRRRTSSPRGRREDCRSSIRPEPRSPSRAARSS